MNLTMILIWICKIKNWEKTEYALGIIILFLGFPTGYVTFQNIINNRFWWTIVIPLVFIAYLIIELLLDYIKILEYDFRENNSILAIYLVIWMTSKTLFIIYILLLLEFYYGIILFWVYVIELIFVFIAKKKQVW
ncbi:MAG: hypothetical protein ACTSR3_16520 [Candidatus Helarchaeota archaeon]